MERFFVLDIWLENFGDHLVYTNKKTSEGNDGVRLFCRWIFF